MSIIFQKIMLEEIGQIVTGKTPSSNVIGAFSSSGIPFVTPKDMDGRRWIETTERYLSEAGRQSLKNYLIPKDSVAVSCIGSDMGKAILLKKDSVTNQQINTIIVDASKHNPKYIYYVLSLKQEELKSIAGGSATPILNKGHFSKVVIELPDKVDQDNIVQVLDSLDCKIELNNQINQTLESIAQAIFKSWFIDFEPVRAKIAAKQEGKDPELAAMCVISGKSEAELKQMAADDFAELQATAALFPDELVDSELGEVPKGWEVSNFKGFCKKIESGGTPKRSELHYWNGEIRWLSSGEVRETVVLDTKEKITKTGLLNSSAKLWEKYTTVIAMYGATAGQVCLLANEMAANQACCGLIPKDEFKSFAFLIARNSVRSLSDKASGSAQQNLNKGIIENQPCVLPRLSVARNFENLVFPLLRKWLANSEENIRLSVIRDSLLPKLLSGEVSLDMV